MDDNKINKRSLAHIKYSVNESYLDKIDTPDKAYILGLFYSDGYNNEKRGRIVINLEEGDSYILESIKNKFNYTGNLLYDKKDGIRKPQYRLSINNKKLSEALVLWGCPQKKTEILMFPDFLENWLIPHFIRGYFDGDGSISRIFKFDFKWNSLYRYYQISFIGTENIVLGIANYFKNTLNLKFNITSACRIKNKIGNPLIKELRISGKRNLINIMEHIYMNKRDLYLRRKYGKYLIFKYDTTDITLG